LIDNWFFQIKHNQYRLAYITFTINWLVKFNSRRSPVYSRKGIVSTSQPLAAMAGISILQAGGNAADAAVATAAALNVTEPTSTGIGGDCFALFYDTKGKKVHGVNGSGRAPIQLSLEKCRDIGYTDNLPPFDANTITVPGAAAGWVDTISRHGTMEMREVLAPAIDLAENGFPVSPITAKYWDRGVSRLKSGPNFDEMLINGEAPKTGQIMKIPNLAKTFRQIVDKGKSGFYEGQVAESIIDIIRSEGGFMELDDLKEHESTFDKPISVNYRGVDVFEIPPNGQGITALIALNLLEEFDIQAMDPLSSNYFHLLIEAMRLAFADSRYYVADPDKVHVPIAELLSKEYASTRRNLINFEKASTDAKRGSPFSSSDTVYLSVADGDGNACSFINSNYNGFGTGLIPKGCGFTLQNRGRGFSLDPDHPNVLAPRKRPYHTIIPAMATVNGELYASFGVMGGFMQPQGHVQVLLNMIDHGMNPQGALDHPRFCINDGIAGGQVSLEDGIPMETIEKLSLMGHSVIPTKGHARSIFGRGQIIRRDPENGVLWAGSDPRADGMAIGL
jgi:gamma-glutamyltranspeptidase/glutathione hydrolase